MAVFLELGKDFEAVIQDDLVVYFLRQFHVRLLSLAGTLIMFIEMVALL